jgi:phosphosulfolactate phosphohydrolase-like enzyme
MAIVVAEQQGGARLCANGFFSDVNGCCPRVLVDNVPSYRDAQVRRTTLALVVAWLHSAMAHIVTTTTIHH